MNRDRDDPYKFSSKPPETTVENDGRWQAGSSSSSSTEEKGRNEYGGKTIVNTRTVKAGKNMVVHSYEKIYKDNRGVTKKQETYDPNWNLLNTWGG